MPNTPIDATRYPLLSKVDSPAELRQLPESDLRAVADELRAYLIESVGKSGGHFGAGLGVVELTTVLHYVYDTPDDRIVWDVGHQCYPHKILTGRRDRIRTLRQGGGLSGFTKRSESEYDPFGAAHSSTSISAALGFAAARDLGAPGVGDAVAVIGETIREFREEALGAAFAVEAALLLKRVAAINADAAVALREGEEAEIAFGADGLAFGIDAGHVLDEEAGEPVMGLVLVQRNGGGGAHV